jgi:hypothetical protein
MRRYLFVVLLLVVVGAIAFAVGVAGDAGAWPTWGNNNNRDSAGCHQTSSFAGTGEATNVHPLHPGQACGTCHDGAPAAGNVDPGNCLNCHGGGSIEGLVQAHPTGPQSTCRVCHQAAVTTTTAPVETTTTVPGVTTTTVPPATTTTVPPVVTTTTVPPVVTTTTVPPVGTTTTILRPTTTTRVSPVVTTPTTLRKATPRFTG